MFTLVNSMPWCSSASCSRTGWTARHGPHHGAQKSTTTGLPACRTSASNVSSVTSFTARSLQTAHERAEPEQRHPPHGFEHDRAAHLRVPLGAVDEDDRHLGDAEAGALGPVRGLDLERVALGVDPVEGDRLQHLAADALEAAGEVAHLNAEDR